MLSFVSTTNSKNTCLFITWELRGKNECCFTVQTFSRIFLHIELRWNNIFLSTKNRIERYECSCHVLVWVKLDEFSLNVYHSINATYTKSEGDNFSSSFVYRKFRRTIHSALRLLSSTFTCTSKNAHNTQRNWIKQKGPFYVRKWQSVALKWN